MQVVEEPRKVGLTWPLIIVLAIAIPLIVVALMLGRNDGERADRLFHLAKALTYGVVIVMAEVGLAFPIRQWRRKDVTGESHHYHDGTRIVEKHYGLPPSRQLPAPAYQSDPLALPSAQRMMFGAMMGNQGRGGYTERPQPQLAVEDYDDADPEQDWPTAPWDLPAEATDGRNDVPPPVGWTGEMRL